MNHVKCYPGASAKRGHYFNQWVDQFFNQALGADMTTNTRALVNIVETENNYRLDFVAAGLQKDDFNIEVRNEELVVSANKTWEAEGNAKYVRREFGNIQFKRSFKLPETVDAQQITAKFENGILSVTLPKKEVQTPEDTSLKVPIL
jgi:HSP20 family protein